MKYVPLKPIMYAIVCGLTLYSCNGSEANDQEVIDEEIYDPNNSLNTVFDGKIFSIPSPVQTAYLIQQLNLDFDGNLLSDEKVVGEFVTEHKQALNLGIYGTDLGYSVMYDQKDVTMRYLGAVEKLTSELGLEAAFDNSFLEKFEKSNDSEQAMIGLMSDAFRRADNFLKYEDRKSTSALILTGGWIESIYFACRLNESKASPEIERRIGEQKQSLNSIIDILTEYNKNGDNDSLIVQMEDLKISFDKITMDYEYAAPETDKENHITTFHHSLDINITKEIIEEIRTKIEAIRSNIIKA